MIHKNKLDKTFGPSGSFAGYIIFIAGIIATYSNPIGLTLVFIGAFVGFSTTSTIIDAGKKRILFSNNLFGLIQTGKWIDIDTAMKLGIKESNITWTTFSRSNRSIDTLNKDFRIVLFDSGGKEIMEISKTKSLDAAKIKLETVSRELELEII
jgi:hypothetical protein